MRRFIIQLCIFLGIVALLAIAGAFACRARLRALHLAPDVTTVICGDSHMVYGLDDRIIPHAVNMSQDAEHYLYTYQKLKLLLPRDPRIKLVVLGMTYHTFSSVFDDFAARRLPEYFLMMDAEGKRDIARRHPAAIMASLPAMAHTVLAITQARRFADCPFWGGFKRFSASRLTDSTIGFAINTYYRDSHGKPYAFSPDQIVYLQRIIGLCQESSVAIILVNTPCHPRYMARIPAAYIDNYRAIVKTLAGGHARCLDYHDVRLPDDWYINGNHLNVKGAAFFSTLISRDIEKMGITQ